jgi:hypothetical protein
MTGQRTGAHMHGAPPKRTWTASLPDDGRDTKGLKTNPPLPAATGAALRLSPTTQAYARVDDGSKTAALPVGQALLALGAEDPTERCTA